MHSFVNYSKHIFNHTVNIYFLNMNYMIFKDGEGIVVMFLLYSVVMMEDDVCVIC